MPRAPGLSSVDRGAWMEEAGSVAINDIRLDRQVPNSARYYEELQRQDSRNSFSKSTHKLSIRSALLQKT